MTQNTKRIALLFLFGTLVSLILLSASLTNLELQAGLPFPDANPHNTVQQTTQQQRLFYWAKPLQGILGLILLLLMICVPVDPACENQVASPADPDRGSIVGACDRSFLH